jgi:hypothetical protein
MIIRLLHIPLFLLLIILLLSLFLTMDVFGQTNFHIQPATMLMCIGGHSMSMPWK